MDFIQREVNAKSKQWTRFFFFSEFDKNYKSMIALFISRQDKTGMLRTFGLVLKEGYNEMRYFG
jgi:hypothetical protein